ncbi:secreted effector protein PipB2 [Azospirillaceae bacterium]
MTDSVTKKTALISSEKKADLIDIKGEINLHQRWAQQRGGRRAELQFRDLSGISLRGINLNSAHMKGVSLVSSDLTNANLSHADLVGADMEGANLTEADLSGCDLRGANLHGALMTGANLQGADLRAVRLDITKFVGRAGGAADLSEAQLNKAIMVKAKLAGCDFSGADLFEADLTDANMAGAVLIGANIEGAQMQGTVFDKAVVDAVTISSCDSANLPLMSLAVEPNYVEITVGGFVAMVEKHEDWLQSSGKEGTRLDLDMVKIPAVDLVKRDLAGAQLRRCRIEGGSWTEIDLTMGDFAYSNMSGLKLMKSNLSGANLRRVVLLGSDLSDSFFDLFSMEKNEGWPTNLEGAVLRNANLSRTSFIGAILRHADISGCITQGIRLRDADLTGAKR